MENWEDRLNEKLKNRSKKDRTRENFFVTQNEIILPTLNKISKILDEHYIKNEIIDSKKLTLKTSPDDFLFDIEFQLIGYGEILFKTTHYIFGVFGENKIKEIEDKTILLNEITEDLVGDLFTNILSKYSKPYNL